jgi:hypothetical protein
MHVPTCPRPAALETAADPPRAHAVGGITECVISKLIMIDRFAYIYIVDPFLVGPWALVLMAARARYLPLGESPRAAPARRRRRRR